MAKKLKLRNPMARALRHGLFRKKIVRDKMAYTRKGRPKENRTQYDSPFNSTHE